MAFEGDTAFKAAVNYYFNFYRIVRLASTKFVEVYPGDGSVILSQGLGGHFYRHIIPRGSQVGTGLCVIYSLYYNSFKKKTEFMQM